MTVEERLEEILREFFNDDEISFEDELEPGDIPGWDSLATVNLSFIIEEAFEISFADSELGELSNLGELRRAVERHRDRRASES